MGLRTGISINRGLGIGSGGIAPAGGGGGIPVGTDLLTFTEGAFSRIGEGSYLAADMQTAAWFATDVPRTGSRGWLFERAFTNHAKTAVEVGASWTAANGAGVGKVAGSTSPGSAPDGSTPAVMTYGSATNSRLTQTIGTGITDNIPITLTGFFRGALPARGNQPAINASIDATVTIPNGTWARHVKVGVSGTAISDVVFFDNDIATVQVVDSFACCCNEGTYPMTPTRSLAAAFTSFPDNLTFLSAQVPLALREAAWTIVVTPEWAPADLVSGDQRWILSFGGANDGLRFRHTGTDVRLEAVVGGSVVASSNAVAGSTREVALTLAINPVAATLTVNGSAGSAGTPWAWPGGVQLRVGGVLGLTSEFDGYIQVPEAA